MRKYFTKKVIVFFLTVAMVTGLVPLNSAQVLGEEVKRAYSVVIEPTMVYEQVYGFFCGKSPVMNKEGKWGIIDNIGREIIPCEYSEVKIINDNIQYLEKREGIEEDWVWGYFNNNNEPVEYKSENISDNEEGDRKYITEYFEDEDGKESLRLKNIEGETIKEFSDYEIAYTYDDYICVLKGVTDMGDYEAEDYEICNYKGNSLTFSTIDDVISTRKNYIMFLTKEKVAGDKYAYYVNVYNEDLKLITRKEYSEEISWLCYYPNFGYINIYFDDYSSEIYDEEGKVLVGNEYDKTMYLQKYDERVSWAPVEYGWLRYAGWETDEKGFFARDKKTHIYYLINIYGERVKEYGKFDGELSIYYWNNKYYFVEMKENQQIVTLYNEDMKTIYSDVGNAYAWNDLFINKFIYKIGLLKHNSSSGYYIDSYTGGKIISNFSDTGIYNENLLPVKINNKWGVYKIDEYCKSVEGSGENNNITTKLPSETVKPSNNITTKSPSETVKPSNNITKNSSKTTKIKKIKKAKKSLKVSWKKVKDVSGYQIQYSTSSKFKGAKKITIKKAGITSKTIKKLKAKKKYYVRIRTYKIVNGKKKYSSWSKKKSQKTK